MKLLNMKNVLCLSPHPDDVEYSMAGTMMKYTDTNFTSVVFSTGCVSDPIANEDRWNECKEYWKGIDNVSQYFLSPLMRMYSEEEWLNLLEKKFNLKLYDAIFLPSFTDTHYEHRFVNGIGMAMTRSNPASIVEYKSLSSTDMWIPNMIIDIHLQSKTKVDLLSKFVSQSKDYFNEDVMKAFHSHIISIRKGIITSEQFKIITLYPTF
jgi:LmbE family N-acetylglucosaminyl deacetylase